MSAPFLFPAALVAFSTAAMSASAFDREVTEALKACHDYVWAVPEFEDMPNAAVSVWPASSNNGITKVYWVVDWDDPAIQQAGTCEYAKEEVIAYNNFME